MGSMQLNDGKAWCLWSVLLILGVSCSFEPAVEKGARSIQPYEFKRNVRQLASDEFQGRRPFTEGESLTVEYLANEASNLGLAPGNGDSYFQDVPLVAITSRPEGALKVKGKKQVDLEYMEDFVASTMQVKEQIKIEDAEWVYAGYGIVAPEYNWNDYADLDVKGKVVVVRVNDPGFQSGDSTFFKGDIMTYYGRWTYKYEEASRQGALGVMIIHETEAAGYGFGVIRNSFTGTRLHLNKDKNQHRCAMQGWLSYEGAQKLFEAAGWNFEEIYLSAAQSNFKAKASGQKLSLSLKNELEENQSKNVIAQLTGTKQAEEVIIYTAHWDHLGKGKKVKGDSIYNGAIDNASGCAALLEIAHAFVKSGELPSRTVVFLWVTAEEQGLLGSAYYVENPIFPIENTLANINVDMLYPFGKMEDLTVAGYGQNDLEDRVAEFAKLQGRTVMPDPNPGAGMYFRSDHFNFAKKGIPALYAKGKTKVVGQSAEESQVLLERFTKEVYHKPQDEYDDAWKTEGMMDDIEVAYRLGHSIANDLEYYPAWKEGSEFKGLRKKE